MWEENKEYGEGYRCNSCGKHHNRFFYKCPKIGKLFIFLRQNGENGEEMVKKGLVDGIIWHNLDAPVFYCEECNQKLGGICPDCGEKMLPFDHRQIGIRQPMAA